MPQSITIGFFVFGAILVLVAILGGNFKLFGAEVSASVGNLFPRVIAFIFGSALIVIVFLQSFSITQPVLNSGIRNSDTAVAPSITPSSTSSTTLSTVLPNGGHLYKLPSREQGMELGLIWPGDQVLRLADEFENINGVWVYVRVVKASPDRGDGCVSEGAEGYARATLISMP